MRELAGRSFGGYHARISLMSRIAAFYDGKIVSSRGEHIEQIWLYDDSQLESIHTYIQWLFPLPEDSSPTPKIPLLCGTDIERFRKTEELRKKLLKSFQLMLKLYGFELRYDPEPIIEPTDRFAERSYNWLTANNHNYFRITRILRSLTLLGLSKESTRFFAALQQVYRRNPDEIGRYIYADWERAIETPRSERFTQKWQLCEFCGKRGRLCEYQVVGLEREAIVAVLCRKHGRLMKGRIVHPLVQNPGLTEDLSIEELDAADKVSEDGQGKAGRVVDGEKGTGHPKISRLSSIIATGRKSWQRKWL
jgi:hypothetical protein